MNPKGFGFGVVRKPIYKRYAKTYCNPHNCGALGVVCYINPGQQRRPGSLWLYNNAACRAKATGVILIYDFLNSPTANPLAVLFLTQGNDMKKYLLSCFVPLLLTNAAMARSDFICYKVASCSTFYVQGSPSKVSTVPSLTSFLPGCAIKSAIYYASSGPDTFGCVWIPTCTKCESGYELVSYDEVPFGNNNYACTTFTTGGAPQYCQQITTTDPDPDENCVSDTTWTSGGRQGYEKLTNRTWNGSKCIVSVQYRCAADWYGTPVVNGTSFSGCNHCPMQMVGPSTWAEVTSRPGATSATMCYLASEYTSSDSTGTFIQYPPCGYSN